MPVKVLFVCLGNICRSPAAEAIMNHLVEAEGLGNTIEIDSAGTGGFHVGDFADPRMVDAGQKRGYRFENKARKVYPDHDFKDFDYILAADKANFSDLKQKMKTPDELENKLFLMCDFCTTHTEKEVPDPYYGEADGFDNVLNILEDACSGLLAHIKKQNL